MKRELRHWSAEEKTKLLRRHLIERVPVSKTYEEARVAPGQMQVSIILCTYNRCVRLGRALESVMALSSPDDADWHVLVVDNNSSDQTRETVEGFRERYPARIRYVFEKKQGKSHALNTGIREAAGDVLAFIDDDVVADGLWLQNLIAAFSDESVAGVGGKVVPNWEVTPPLWLPRATNLANGPLVIFDLGDEPGPLLEAPFGTNMAFRKSVFDRYGGFRTDLGPCPGSEIRGEDSEFCCRLLAANERLYYMPTATVRHEVTADRVNRNYFLAWWFDKGRSTVRELGARPGTKYRWRGVPLYWFRSTALATAKWLVSVDSATRFACKLEVWCLLGQVSEFHGGFRREDAAVVISGSTRL